MSWHIDDFCSIHPLSLRKTTIVSTNSLITLSYNDDVVNKCVELARHAIIRHLLTINIVKVIYHRWILPII